MCGGSWLLRDHHGKAQFHARDIVLPAENRTAGELRCILWAVQSLSDLQITDVELWSQCGAAIEALNNPCDWPKYRSLFNRFQRIRQKFRYCEFKNSSAQANLAARRISHSITQDGRVNSYLTADGPGWLHSILENDCQ
ncbi:putative protein phosphatase 2C-like protein 45 [Cardamine amara subsp. amara]|uniref:RNase H type-1 domain-containing protein n=1 Tax=Cardamine amara subsp. amara TaxID=228776 RepID=A0ABD1BM16_CARAN